MDPFCWPNLRGLSQEINEDMKTHLLKMEFSTVSLFDLLFPPEGKALSPIWEYKLVTDCDLIINSIVSKLGLTQNEL